MVVKIVRGVSCPCGPHQEDQSKTTKGLNLGEVVLLL